MSGQHRRGHLATPSGGAVQAVGLGAIVCSIFTALVVAVLSVSGAVQSSASEQVGVRPAAATASPSSDGPVSQPRDATAPAATAAPSTTGAATKAARPSTLVKTGAPSAALLSGAALAFVAGVALLLLGRDLPFGRHERAGRPRHSAAF
jgi:hypothetical protein